MPGSVVTCPSCEKKYRIPEGTDVREFTCKACGAEIPLADEPAAGHAGRRAGGGGRRGRREAPPPKSNTPVIVGAAASSVQIAPERKSEPERQAFSTPEVDGNREVNRSW